MLPNHAPLVIAEQFGTLESLYPGRIDLGLGRAPGSDQATASALRRTLQTNGDDFPELLEELRFFFQNPIENQRVQAVPGGGLNVPIWLLSSSGFSPEYILPAFELYRKNFKPSDALEKPRAMLAINVVAAESDAEAEYLATSQHQSFLNLVRGKPGKLQPPVKNMDEIWNEREQALVESRTGGSVVGGRETVRAGLERILQATEADELMINAMIYDRAARFRSYEIVAEVWQNQAAKSAA
jgi:alkanesulfonate monooxygenase SsuD/methylene tetrahydromethanopterin reductase-like flavin-dependent oxidoreductase (luciferase family)